MNGRPEIGVHGHRHRINASESAHDYQRISVQINLLEAVTG
jgi:hypothetical protein